MNEFSREALSNQRPLPLRVSNPQGTASEGKVQRNTPTAAWELHPLEKFAWPVGLAMMLLCVL